MDVRKKLELISIRCGKMDRYICLTNYFMEDLLDENRKITY